MIQQGSRKQSLSLKRLKPDLRFRRLRFNPENNLWFQPSKRRATKPRGKAGSRKQSLGLRRLKPNPRFNRLRSNPGNNL